MQPQLFQMDLACTDEVGVIQFCYASPERTRKFMRGMEVSIVESIVGCNTDNKVEQRQKKMLHAGFKQLRRPHRQHRREHCVLVINDLILFANENGRTISALQHKTERFAARHYYYIVPRGLTPLLYARLINQWHYYRST